MSSPAPKTFAAKLAEKEAQLKTEQQLRQALETRAAVQIQKLADNNAALARMNHRLSSQLDRLKAEQDQLEHLTAGQAAVARAKESELASEINGLKHLLKESLAERATLHAQLIAKQEILRYLEWRLAQMEQLVEGKEHAPCGGPLSAAFKEAAQVAAGEPPLDSFPVLPDDSVSTQSSSVSGNNLPRTLLALGQRGLVGIPTTAWAPPGVEAEKENIDARHPRPDTTATATATPGTANPGQFTPIRSSVRSALGDITPRLHPRAVVADNNTPVAALVSTVLVAPAPATAAGQGEEQPDNEEAIDGNTVSLIVEESNVEDGRELPPSELEGSSTAAAPSTDLKKQLFAEYSSADLKYVDDDEDEAGNEECEVKPVKVAVEKKKEDGLDVQIKQMHTPIAKPSQSQQQREKDEKEQQNQTAADTPEINANKNSNDKNNSTALTPAGGTTPGYSASATPATSLRSSSRVRRSVSYALPPVNRKLRQGDPFTFGDPTTIRKKNPSSSSGAGGTGSAVPRSRTKPRAKYAASFKKPRRKSLSIRGNGANEDDSPSMATPPHVGVLPAMAEQEDYTESGSGDCQGAVEVLFS